MKGKAHAYSHYCCYRAKNRSRYSSKEGRYRFNRQPGCRLQTLLLLAECRIKEYSTMQDHSFSEILFYVIIAAPGLFILYKVARSFFANPGQFIETLTVKVFSFFFGIFKFIFHVIQGLLVFFLGIVYAIFPIDFIPDFIVGLGQMDDLVALIGTFAFFISKCFTFPKPEKISRRR